MTWYGGEGNNDMIKKHERLTGDARAKATREVKKLYDAGNSIRDIAATTGRSYGWVHRTLTDNGVRLRSRGGANRKR